MPWIIALLIGVPFLVVGLWVLFDDSVVRVPPGRLGLVLLRGKPTGRILEPGVHWVPAFRRLLVVEYPSLELAFRSGEPSTFDRSDDPTLERAGAPLTATLGDRAGVVLTYTIRYRLDETRLREVHERFGPDGIWSLVRDVSARTLRRQVAEPRWGIDDLFQARRCALEAALTEVLRESLAVEGFILTMFTLGDAELGRAGEVIQATVRAPFELARENAEAEMRSARARRRCRPVPRRGQRQRGAPVPRDGRLARHRHGARHGVYHAPGAARRDGRAVSEAPPELRPRRAVRLLEVVGVALLGTATLGSAWCGYQASRWNSNERDLAREAAGFQLEAGRLYGLATQTLVYDGIVISDYAAAVSAGDEELQQFYDEALVRPGLRPVIERWRQDAASGQGAPTSLLEDEAYRQEQLAPYDAAVARGAEASEASETASRHADDYVLVRCCSPPRCSSSV